MLYFCNRLLDYKLINSSHAVGWEEVSLPYSPTGDR